MNATRAQTASAAPMAAAGRQPLGRWWRRQTPTRQDRYATLGPLVSVLLFLAAMVSAFWYLRNEEFDREAESVKRDTETAQVQIRLRLIENQEQLVRLARDLRPVPSVLAAFAEQTASFIQDRPEVTEIAWLDAQQREVARIDAAGPVQGPHAKPPDPQRAGGAAGGPAKGTPAPAAADPGTITETSWAFVAARDLRQPIYSRAFRGAGGQPVFQVQVPLQTSGSFTGTLAVTYSVETILRHFVPTEVTRRHTLSVLDDRERLLASTVQPMPGRRLAPPELVHDVPVAPAANGLVLRGTGYRVGAGLVGNTLFWMVVALSILTVWMLLGTWRHMRRRTQIQETLVQETSFRRAMENSMLTGMRAVDAEGRVTYVNPAFCAMTGFSEAELIGRLPPYPYWPHDRIEENHRLLMQQLQGRTPAGGIEVKVMRKNGSLFDARMYVSPLVDARGQQTGWMTSMTNITEAKRIRDQLSASHERFTTVLEGLDAAVSVLSVQQGELLFTNRSYRLWFGAEAQGHALLASGSGPHLPSEAGHSDEDGLSGLPAEALTDRGAHPREVYVPALDKWFDVRSRYLQWTDGRLAQMLIATDVTARRRAEELAEQQAEKAQVSSRLITMGEMASSVAHELNQPLTAITNYCNGMLSRVKAGSITEDALIAALDKTARQAERAGQIIHRIRAFVKKSEPQRVNARPETIVNEAVELASIELRRRHVQIHAYVAQRLPDLRCDPILIEQVLMNLLKNAAEAIDHAKLPPGRRHIELRVVPRHTPDEGGAIEFSVTDMGPGLAEGVLDRLYEAFFSTKADGMGIGLSLCRSIVESHRGRIKAQNLYNGTQITGCRFSFTLPVDISPRSDDASPAPESAPIPLDFPSASAPVPKTLAAPAATAAAAFPASSQTAP